MPLLLLDAGDSLVGDQAPATDTLGATSVELMNRLGYDAAALGGRDLALGVSVLRQRMAEAKFPLLSANAVDAGSGRPIGQPYAVLTAGGRRIAIVGLSEVSAADGISVSDPLAAARAIVPEAAREADAVVLLSHAGGAVDRQIADSVPGIALIVEGGGPALAAARPSAGGGALLVHADEGTYGHAGRRVGVAELVLNGQGQIAAYEWRAVALSPDYADAPAVADWVSQVSK